jgi:CRP-like cAMP-binding protein
MESRVSDTDLSDLLFAKLSIRRDVPARAINRLSQAFSSTRRVSVKEDLVVEGAYASTCMFLTAGFCARYRILADGRRQFTEICIPGDFVNLGSLLKKRQPQGLTALTDCRTAVISHSALDRLIREEPELMRSLWLETLVDGAISREWVLSLGVQNAKERFARFFCELFMRMEIVGLTEGDGFRLTMTQTEMSDMLGMSAVHVNRIIGELREEGLIEMSGGRVRLPDLEALAALGEFESAYLEAPADLLRAIA